MTNPGGPDLALYTEASGAFPRADRSNWWATRYSVDSFSRLDEILPASRSGAPAAPRPWQAGVAGGAAPALSAAVDAYLARNPTTGLLIARDDTVLVERYQYGRTDTHRLTSFSMAKRLVAMMIGIALSEGHIRSLDDPAQTYDAGLLGSAYGATPIRHLLTMSSGVRFREDYDGTDDSARLSQATVRGASPGGAQAARLFDDRIAAPGQRWSYASGETFVLALVLRGATGRPLAEYFAERIWRPLGAQADATWLIDRSGQAVGYMGFNAVLRDYGRLALLLARHGRVDDRQLIPADWVREASRAHFSARQTGRWYGYGYQTWVFPENDGSFALLGVRGQAIFVDPATRLVMVHTAVRPGARDPGGAQTVALWRELRRAMPR
ncbi:MAG: serine hydrolase [Burkholderiales bacterium]|nr:serine hydrolase [Burkholderiales bacterium]